MEDRRTVLVAVDHSEASERVVRFVNRFFAGLGVEIVGINVGELAAAWIPMGLAAGATSYWPAIGALPQVDEGARDERLREAAATVASSGLNDDDVVVDLGDPVTLICQAAIDHHADLVVVGDSHKSAWRRLLEGSVHTEIERRAACPVLVVP